MIHSLILINRQGKVRLIKWYESFPMTDRTKMVREVNIIILIGGSSQFLIEYILLLKFVDQIAVTVIGRSSRLSNFIEWNQYKIIYKRYASLYFITLCDKDDNELIILEMIHHYVECLDRYFGNVCELDIIFNFHKAYYIIEEILAAGYIQESGK